MVFNQTNKNYRMIYDFSGDIPYLEDIDEK